jgi:pSer/pThr/pTyr-binding forkhead associated (FHA) protein
MSEALFLEALAPGGDSDPTLPPAELPRQGRLVIGSSEERASFLITGQGVADVHCTIGRLKAGGWALKDLGSDFGTMVNGKKVDAAKLKNGDEIVIGSRKLRIFSTASKSAGAPKASPKSVSPKSVPPKDGAPKKAQPAAPKKARTRELGGYRLEKPLGRGAMGDVYLAVQTSLDRRVALKVLKSELAKDATFVRRFRDEARSAARLNHPNIVTIFDVGEEGGQHFLSMEYMDGSSLEEQLKKGGPIPWKEALEILRDAAAGLVYAETSGIVHRDIKPENLMRNKDGVTKIADLGLAVQVEQEGVDSEAGKVFGTPHFLAPEVVRGAAATASSDLYSLGATAYRVLSGHTPFEGKGAREILRSALQDEAPPLAQRVPGLPAAMAATVHRLLAKDPADRHPSAAILLAEIERLRQSGGQVGGADLATAKAAGLPKPLLIGGGALLAVGAAAMLALGGGKGEEPAAPGAFPSRGGSADTEAPGASVSDVASVNGSNAPSMTTEGTGIPETGAGPTAPGDDGAEQSFEFKAKSAYAALGDENLSPADRALRLRILAQSYAGTDVATQASAEANEIEAVTAEASASEATAEAARTTAIAAIRGAAALDTDPFLPGDAIKAVQAVVLDPSLETDLSFQRARNELIDEVMQLGIARGTAALAAADAATKEGSFTGTKSALESFVAIAQLPSPEEAKILVGSSVPGSVAEFRTLGETASTRLSLLAGSETEFEANRLAKERAMVGGMLASQLEAQLAGFELSAAAATLESAAGMTTEEPLRSLFRERAGDLKAANAALRGLVDGWSTPGWRRRSVMDPRPGESGSVEIVGVDGGTLKIDDGGEQADLKLSSWAGHTAKLENLFLGRLKRDWSPEESRGIAGMLALSATLETLASLEPALGATAMRVSPADASAITASFDKAVEWAQNTEEDLGDELRATLGDRTLTGIVREQLSAATMLAEALIARDEGEWAASTERLERLLKERRDSWLVMMLSRGTQ